MPFAEFVAALFPSVCWLCGAASSGPVCAQHALPERPHGARCGTCARQLSAALPDGARCAYCRRHPPGFRHVFVLADYEGACREWLLALKHGGRKDLARPLGAALARRVAGHSILVPVPLHPLRRFERGYDQALLLAEEVAVHSGGACLRALQRVRSTHVQGAPGAASRAANVRAAFRVPRRAAPRIAGKELLLVDDVLTSGSTASECARALRRAGAKAVDVLAIARAGSLR
jgi:ComF family protein